MSGATFFLKASLAATLLVVGCGKEAQENPANAPGGAEPAPEEVVVFKDANLEAVIREALNGPTRALVQTDLDSLTRLEAKGRGIADLNGIEHLNDLQALDLADNQVKDLFPLSALTHLTFLELSNNQVEDLAPLSGLVQLQYVGLLHNAVRDISPLLNLTQLQNVDLSGNPLDERSQQNHLRSLKARGVQVDYTEYTAVEEIPLLWQGKIAFVRDGDLYVIFPDRSQPVNLTASPAYDSDPAWSPDGTQIAFDSDRDKRRGDVDFHEIFAMNADGSNVVNLTQSPAYDSNPAWSPDGTQIAFVSSRDGNFDVFVMNADGSNPTNLTRDNYGSDTSPTWSPDGAKIAFSSVRGEPLNRPQIYVMDADGSHQTRLGEEVSDIAEWNPAWSPDGTQIAFATGFLIPDSHLYLIEVASRTRVRLTEGAAQASDPAWSPDGTQIVATWAEDYNLGIMDLESRERLSLTARGLLDLTPSWSK